jgi:hypothetical protein
MRFFAGGASFANSSTALAGPSGALGQSCICRGFVDEDQPRQHFVEETPSTPDPQITSLCDLRPALFACLEAFFIAQSKLMQKPANRGAMHFDTPPGQFDAQLI